MYELKGRYIVEFPDIPKERKHQIEIPVDERRGNYSEVELGFDEERALEEAKRCLSCRRCLGCALCWAECKPEAIDFDMPDEEFVVEADEVVISCGVERPLGGVGHKLGLGNHYNVITDLALERMLSPDGPTRGIVIRPFDGDCPARVAFVQSYDGGPEPVHLGSLRFALNEGMLLKRVLPDAEVMIFAADIERLLKEHGDVIDKLEGIEILEATVEGMESLEDQSLKLSVSTKDGTLEETFDLVVLITLPRLPKSIAKLGEGFGLELEYSSFAPDGDAGLVETENGSVKLAPAE